MKHFVQENYFEIVNDVTHTWTDLKKIPDYQAQVGVELFSRYDIREKGDKVISALYCVCVCVCVPYWDLQLVQTVKNG